MSKITEAEIDRLKTRLGTVVESRDPPFLTEITRDAIRHWAWGTGDRNPLYFERDHAVAAGHADVVAPPTMLYAFSRNATGYKGGLPGVHSVFGGSHWKWHRPLAVGTPVETQTVLKDVRELPSKFAGRMVKVVAATSFTDAGAAPLADVQSWGLRFERGAARERNPENSTVKPKPSDAAGTQREARFPDERIGEITAAYRAEAEGLARRPDLAAVGPGFEIPSMIRGPYSSTNAIAFEMAWGGAFIWAHGYWYDFLSRHPGASMRNEEGVPEAAEAVHWDGRASRRAGVAGVYDIGPERVAWMATLVTNWAGPVGFLSELYCEVRGFNVSPNILRCSGTVVSKEVVDGSQRIRLNLRATDDAGKIAASGWAIVEFPA